jgi:hypothetical protein
MYSAVLSYSVPEHFSPQSILVNNIIYFLGKIENDEGDEYILYKYDFETGIQKKITELSYDESTFLVRTTYRFMQKGRSLTYQYGKYLISVKELYFNEDICYYRLDMENDRFDLIQIPRTQKYGIDYLYCSVIYNYIYYYSVSSDIERYNIITREREEVLRSNYLVFTFRRKLKKYTVCRDDEGFAIVGNWIYYSDDKRDGYKIDIKKKTEQQFEMRK